MEQQEQGMKLLIAADMEGITGVVDREHTNPAHAEYQRFRKLMTADVNAAIHGAVAAGVQDIVVSDGHAGGRNILIEELDSRARLNCGSPSPYSMVNGIDTGVNAAFFIGYHARVGTPQAVLDHTWSGATIGNVWINDRIAGEIGLNASVCGHFGVPVLLISGDQNACAEGEGWIPGIEIVTVKNAWGRTSAECLPPAVTHDLIAAAAERAVRRFQAGSGPAVLETHTPVKAAVEFLMSEMTDNASLLPGAVRQGKTITIEAADMAQAYRGLRAAMALAAK
jgi:D-amino peptidase